MELISIVEALLFATQEPLGVPQMCAAVKDTAKDIVESASEDVVIPEWVAPLAATTEEQVRAILDELIARYEAEKHSFTLVERANGWRIAARGQYAEWCRALYPGKKVQRLSQPALETLAIVAYRQPITKAGIEAVRGVSVDAMVQQLIDRGLMKIEGRADLPGVAEAVPRPRRAHPHAQRHRRHRPPRVRCGGPARLPVHPGFAGVRAEDAPHQHGLLRGPAAGRHAAQLRDSGQFCDDGG